MAKARRAFVIAATRAYKLASCPARGNVFYSANFEAMNELIGFLTEKCCAGAPCVAVDALKPRCGEAS
jgi:hypothetical protein